MTSFPLLLTQRLVLRELVPDDAEALFDIHSDEQVMRWFGADPIATVDQAKQLIAMFADWRTPPASGTRWAIVRRADDQLLGTAGLFKWNRSWHNCVLGYELGRAYWSMGYMQEALHAMLDYGFSTMHLHRVQAEIHPDNAASIRVVQRLGFSYEGTHRQQGFWGQRFHDLQCFSLLASEWPPTSTDA
ncbi:MAG: GNAT family N-acetyltransferase [Burkholderiales bacterium]|nr:GNAT family N-acetyltransferase [Burkholderiales bacterium]